MPMLGPCRRLRFLAAALVLTAGCAGNQGFALKSSEPVGAAEAAEAPDDPFTESAALAELPDQSEKPAPMAGQGIDAETFQTLMAELKELSRTDPEAHAQLIETLEDVDPAMVGPLLQSWRVALAYKNRQQVKQLDNAMPSETTTASRDPVGEQNETASDPREQLELPFSWDRSDQEFKHRATARDASSNTRADSMTSRPSNIFADEPLETYQAQRREGVATAASDPYARNSSKTSNNTGSQDSFTARGGESYGTGDYEPFNAASRDSFRADSETDSFGSRDLDVDLTEFRDPDPHTLADARSGRGAVVQTSASLAEGTGANQAIDLPVNATRSSLSGRAPRRSQSWDAYLQRLIEIAEQEPVSGSTPDGIKRQVFLRLLYLMAGQQEKALIPISGASPADQEFWKDTLWALGNYFDQTGIPSEADRATQTVLQLTAAASRLREKANLDVRNLAFCYRIQSYGTYDRFPTYEFSPGQKVLLYGEVENFHSEATAEGYRTVLSSTVEILDAQGNRVWRQDFPPTEDTCRNRRRDYFHSYSFNMPEQLSSGGYVLKLIIEDQLAGKVAEKSIKFTIK